MRQGALLAIAVGTLAFALACGRGGSSVRVDPDVTAAAAVPPLDPVHPATTRSGVHEGTIAEEYGDTLTLTTTGGQTPPVGAKGNLATYVETDTVATVGSAHTDLWVDVADVVVTASTPDQVVCDITSQMTFVEDGHVFSRLRTGVKTHLTF